MEEENEFEQNEQDLFSSDERDFREYVASVTTLESIHKVVQVQHHISIPSSKKKKQQQDKKHKKMLYLLSLRVVTPAKHPVTSATALLTTSNQTFSNAVASDLSIPPAPYQRPTVNTISLLAGMNTNMPALTASLTYNDLVRDGGNPNNKEMAPRILLTYTNARDEFYECELKYEELSNHRKDMNMDQLTWSNYLNHMHRGLFLYFMQSEEDQQQDSEHVRVEFDEENAESKDLLKMTIMSPLIVSDNSSSSDEPQIRLKYIFQLYAVRDANDFSDKLQSLVFDMATYSENLYRARVMEDKKTIDELRRQLLEKNELLQDANDRLSLFRPANYNDDPIALMKQNNAASEVGSAYDDDERKNKPNQGVKRKAPKSLLHPSQKRRAGGGGARIQ